MPHFTYGFVKLFLIGERSGVLTSVCLSIAIFLNRKLAKVTDKGGLTWRQETQKCPQLDSLPVNKPLQIQLFVYHGVGLLKEPVLFRLPYAVDNR